MFQYDACGLVWCAGLSEERSHVPVAFELCLPCVATGQDCGKMSADVGCRHLVCYELGDYLFAANEVDEGDVGHAKEEPTQEGYDATGLRVVADDLGYAEEGCFECGGAAGDEGCRAVLQQAEGLAPDPLNADVH